MTSSLHKKTVAHYTPKIKLDRDHILGKTLAICEIPRKSFRDNWL